MPMVGKKKFAYTKKGKEAAKNMLRKKRWKLRKNTNEKKTKAGIWKKI